MSSDPAQLLTRGDVAELLGIPLRKLTWWVWVLDEDRRYKRFELGRRGGGAPRPIHAPIKPIKDIQRRLAEYLTALYQPRAQVHGFVPERSPATNAQAHLRQRWVLRVDLADFFPSINFGRVRGLFGAFPFDYPPDVATLLAQVCCHKNELPQGAPTSPIVSNYICRRLDADLAELARAERCYYTRYADDLTFSTDRTTFPASFAELTGGVTTPGSAIEGIVKRNGFAINVEKTHLMRETQRQRVTGLVVNKKSNVSRDYVRSLRNLLYIWNRYGENAAMAAFERTAPHRNWPLGKSPPPFRSVVQGRVQYVGSIKGWSSPVYAALAESLAAVDETFTPRQPTPLPTRIAVRLFTEGESDGLHMEAAQRYFHDRGEFTDLQLEYGTYGEKRGDAELLRHCEGLARTKQATPCVCLFDRDNATTLRRALRGESDWANWSNGVVAVALRIPPHRDAADRLCIEMLYDDSLLAAENSEGRRVFLLSEFNERSGHHESQPYSTPNPQSKALVREAVYEFETEKSMALSKMDFARAIREGNDPYSDASFEGFRPTFELIQEAVGEASSDLS